MVFDLIWRRKCDQDFQKACYIAKLGMTNDGLDPGWENNYTQEQAAKAACHGRQDIAATLIIQSKILERLDSIKRWVIACFILLVLIALNH